MGKGGGWDESVSYLSSLNSPEEKKKEKKTTETAGKWAAGLAERLVEVSLKVVLEALLPPPMAQFGPRGGCIWR